MTDRMVLIERYRDEMRRIGSHETLMIAAHLQSAMDLGDTFADAWAVVDAARRLGETPPDWAILENAEWLADDES